MHGIYHSSLRFTFGAASIYIAYFIDTALDNRSLTIYMLLFKNFTNKCL